MLYPIIRRQRRPLLPPEEMQLTPVVSAPVVEPPKIIEMGANEVPVISTERKTEAGAAEDGAPGELRPTEVTAEVIAPDLNLVAQEQPVVKGKRAKVSQSRKTETE